MDPFPYTISHDEGTGTGLLRVLRLISERLKKVPNQPGEDSLHEVRTTIKLLRALLWLAKPAFSTAAFEEIKLELRRAAKSLAGPRDASVLHATLEDLGKKIVRKKQKVALRRASQKLSVVNGRPSIRHDPCLGAIETVQRAIHQFRRDIETVPQWKSPKRRLRRAFAVMEKARCTALKSHDDLDLHAWRKKAKRFYYLLQVLAPHPKRKIKRLTKRVDKIQDRLGNCHDLAVLESKLRAKLPEKRTRKPLLKLLQKRKRRLARDADIDVTKANPILS